MPTVLTESAIIEQIKNHISKTHDIKIAAPYWGADSVDLLGLSSVHHKSASFICDLESGACNPKPIRELIDTGWEVRSDRRLHAKVYLFTTVRLLGRQIRQRMDYLVFMIDQKAGMRSALRLVLEMQFA